MIRVMLRDLRWRLLLVAVVGFFFFLSELSLQREAAVGAAEMGPEGNSAPAGYLAGISMIILLAGFISTDRRQGYARLFFSYPVHPLAFYGLRLVIAYVLSLAAAAVLLLSLQMHLWGTLSGGVSALLLPALTALVFGALMAFLSSAVPVGDAAIAVLFYVPTLLPPVVLEWVTGLGGSALQQLLLFVLPPQTTALSDVYQGLITGNTAWDAVSFVIGYSAVWLGIAVLVIQLRELP